VLLALGCAGPCRLRIGVDGVRRPQGAPQRHPARYIMPFSALVLRLFLEMNLAGWTTRLGRSCSRWVFPFGVYLCYIFFSSTIPKSCWPPPGLTAPLSGTSSADRTAGSPARSGARRLLRLRVRLDQLFLPYVMFANDRQYPLPVGLEYLISSASLQPGGGRQQPGPPTGAGMAALVAIAPVFIVFLFAQRALVTGMLAGPRRNEPLMPCEARQGPAITVEAPLEQSPFYFRDGARLPIAPRSAEASPARPGWAGWAGLKVRNYDFPMV